MSGLAGMGGNHFVLQITPAKPRGDTKNVRLQRYRTQTNPLLPRCVHGRTTERTSKGTS